jgi:hypothetical protein
MILIALTTHQHLGTYQFGSPQAPALHPTPPHPTHPPTWMGGLETRRSKQKHPTTTTRSSTVTSSLLRTAPCRWQVAPVSKV